MVKTCLTCAYYAPQVYNKTFLPLGICCHLGFFKSGIGKMVNGEIEVEFKNRRDRLPLDLVLEKRADNRHWVDIIDIRNKFRHCDHYRSPQTLAQDAFKHYGDTIDQFRWIHPAFIRWWDAGCPMEPKHYAKMRPFHLFEYTVPEIDDNWFTKKEDEPPYHHCSMCHHFRWNLTPDGGPIPFRDQCKQDLVKGGLFDMMPDENQTPCYTFFSCEKFLLDKTLDKRLMYEDSPLPIKLFPFVETNEMDLPMTEYEHLYRFPSITRNVLLNMDEHRAIMDMDLKKLLRDEVGAVNRKKFQKDMGLATVQEFFKKRIVKATKHKNIFYKRFKSYTDDSLFK